MTESDKKLGIQAAETFPELFSDNTGHDTTPNGERYVCWKCAKTWPYKGNDPCELDKRKCTIPDPIEITWDNAMMLFREVSNGKAMAALIEVFQQGGEPFSRGALAGGAKRVIFWWALRHGEPKHLILAAIKAKEDG